MYNEDNECPICLDTICQEDMIKLNNCKHIFHKNCIWEWQKNNNSCPLCRKNICNFYFVKHNPFPLFVPEPLHIPFLPHSIHGVQALPQNPSLQFFLHISKLQIFSKRFG